MRTIVLDGTFPERDLKRAAYKWLHSRGIHGEMAQDHVPIMLACAWKVWKQHGSAKSFGYYCGVMANTMREQARLALGRYVQKAAAVTAIGTDKDIAERADNQADPHTAQETDQAEARVVMEPLLAVLPEREARIVQKYFFDDMTYSEIARSEGVSESRVFQMVQQAVRRMRRAAGEPADGPIVMERYTGRSVKATGLGRRTEGRPRRHRRQAASTSDVSFLS